MGLFSPISNFKSALLFTLILMSFGSLAESTPHERVFPSAESIDYMAPQDVSPNGTQYLFIAEDRSIAGIEASQQSRLKNVYLYDIETQAVSLISKSFNDTASDGRSYAPVFVNNDSVIYWSHSSDIVDGVNGRSGEIYIYNISSATNSYIERPANESAQLTEFQVNSAGTFLVAKFGNGFYRYDLVSGTWSLLTNAPEYGYLLRVADNGEVFFYYEHLLKVSLDGTRLDFEHATDTWWITTNGRYAAKFIERSSTVERIDLTAPDQPAERFVLKHHLFQDVRSGYFTMSPNGRFVTLSGVLLPVPGATGYQPSFISLMMFDLDTLNGLSLNYSEQYGYAGTSSRPVFSDNGNSVLFTRSQQHSASGYLAHFNLDDNFDYVSAVSNVAVTKNSQLNVELTFTGEADYFAVERTEPLTGTQQRFFLDQTTLNDYKQGLGSGLHYYDVSACSINLLCDASNGQVVEVDAMGFDSFPELSFSVERENVNTSFTRVDFSADLISGTEYVQFKSLGSNNTQTTNGTFNVNTQNGKELAIRARFCLGSSGIGYSCDEFGEPLIVKVPQFGSEHKFQALVLPDHSGINISWPAADVSDYRLYRVVNSQDKTLIYEGINTYFNDTDIEYGDLALYILEICAETLCIQKSTSTLKFDRQNSQGSVNISTLNDGKIDVRVNLRYAYDTITLYRQIADNSEPAQRLATLDPLLPTYTDRALALGQSYDYWAELCYQGSCESVTSTYAGGSDFRLNVSSFSSTPANLSVVNEYYGAATVSWSEVAGADGYVLSYQTPNSGPLEVVLWGQDKTTTNIIYGGELGAVYEYSVQSFVASNIEDRSHYLGDSARSDPSPTVRLSSIESVTSSQILEPILKLGTRYNLGKVVGLALSQTTRYDYINVYAKEQSEAEFSLKQRFDRGESLTVSEDITDNTVYEYKVQLCLNDLDNCSAFSNAVRVEYYTDLSTSLTTNAPQLIYNPKGALDIIPDIPDNQLIHRVEAKLFRNTEIDSFRTLSAYNSGATFSYSILGALAPGDRYRAITRHCYRDDVTNYNVCSEWSDESELTLADDVVAIPRSPSGSIRDVEVSSDAVTLTYRLTLNSFGLSHPTNMQIFRGINNGPLEQIAHVDNLENENNSRSFTYSYQDDDLRVGESVRYQATACNAAGCSGFGNIIATTLYQKTPEILPEPSRIESIESADQGSSVMVAATEIYNADRYKFYVGTSLESMRSSYGNAQGNVRFLLSGLETDTRYFIYVQACNEVGCSKESDTEEFVTASRNIDDLSLSGEILREARSNRLPSHLWQATGSARAYKGKLDALSGSLNMQGFVDLTRDVTLTNDVYLSINDVNSCHSVYQQGLTLPVDLYASNNYQALMFEVLYTGSGCNDNLDLEIYSYYLDSPYFDAPILLTEPDSWIKNWHTLAVNITENGEFTLSKDGEQVASSSTGIDQTVHHFSQLYWQSSNESWMSDFSIKVQNPEETALDLSLLDSNSLRLHTPHPRLLRLEFPNTVDMLTWRKNDSGFEQVAAKQSGEVTDSVYQYISGLRPDTEYTHFIKLCGENGCAPTSVRQERTANYSVLGYYYPEPSAGGRDAGTLDTTIYVMRSGQAVDNYTLSIKSSEETVFSVVYEKSYLDIIDELPSFSQTTFQYPIPGLVEGATYVLKLEVCNPLGCFETRERNATVPADSDQDGVVDRFDAFPLDPAESSDTDRDGIGNNADPDDDGDLLPDEYEISNGLDPLSSRDKVYDLDQDGYNNLLEFMLDTSPSDPLSNPENSGTFVSFERLNTGPLSINTDVIGAEPFYNYDSWLPHGLIFMTLNVESDKTIEMRIDAEFNQGKIGWAVRYNPGNYKVEIDGVERTDVEVSALLNNWYYYTLDIEEGQASVVLSFESDSVSSTEKRFLFDAFYLPISRSDAAYDVNLDNRSDVMWRNHATGQIAFWQMDGAEYAVNDALPTVKNQDWVVVGQGDFNGNGYSDVLWRHQVTGEVLYWSMANGQFDQSVSLGEVSNPNWQIVGIGDLDANGGDDIIWRQSETGDNAVWLTNPDGTARNSSITKIANVDWEIKAVGDVDKDGRADLIWRNRATGDNTLWLMNGSEIRERANLQRVSNSWEIMSAADFNGDGYADILWRNPESGANTIWFMNGFTHTDSLELNTVRNNAWQIQATGDYDGNGVSDIFWRNGESGDNTIWFFNPDKTMQNLSTNGIGNLNWRVAQQ